jgi:hypothetical protein
LAVAFAQNVSEFRNNVTDANFNRSVASPEGIFVFQDRSDGLLIRINGRYAMTTTNASEATRFQEHVFDDRYYYQALINSLPGCEECWLSISEEGFLGISSSARAFTDSGCLTITEPIMVPILVDFVIGSSSIKFVPLPAPQSIACFKKQRVRALSGAASFDLNPANNDTTFNVSAGASTGIIVFESTTYEYFFQIRNEKYAFTASNVSEATKFEHYVENGLHYYKALNVPDCVGCWLNYRSNGFMGVSSRRNYFTYDSECLSVPDTEDMTYIFQRANVNYILMGIFDSLPTKCFKHRIIAPLTQPSSGSYLLPSAICLLVSLLMSL